MSFFIRGILPILFSIIIFVTWLASGLYSKKKMSEIADFFIPIIGSSLELQNGYSYYYYLAKGSFQNRDVFIATSSWGRFFRKQFIEISVRLYNYRLKPFRIGSGGVHFQYEGKKYLVGSHYLASGNDKLTSRIKITNLNEELIKLIKGEFQNLCNIADKIDSGEIKYDFLLYG